MTPYYCRSGIILYHGDCREVLPAMPRASVDLMIADPPYGVSWQSNHRNVSFARIEGDDSEAVAQAGIQAALRVLRPYRHAYVFGRVSFDSLSLTSPVELIWDKGQPAGGNVKLPWAPEHEYIQFGVYVPSKANRTDGYGRLAARLRRGSVISCPRVNGVAVTRHPTEKPVRLLRELIESSSCLGEKILDPFAGVGSTLEAALLEGRQAIGIELVEKYCEATAKRLDAVLG